MCILKMVNIAFLCAIKNIWLDLGCFFQARWEQVLDIIGDDPFIHWTILPFCYVFVLYCVTGFIYTYMDLTGKPSFIKKYKIQDGTNEPLDNTKLPKLIIVNLFNLCFVNYFALRSVHSAMQWRGYPDIRELPTLPCIVFELAVHTFVHEMGLYYTHRIFHSRLFYKRIHKLHHEWTSPVAITAFYTHPVEHAVSNLFSALFSIALFRSHVITALIWYTGAITIVLHTHSGYHFPFLPSPEAHDFHHASFIECFGPLGIFDHIHGTNKRFLKSILYTRHVITTTFKSPKELFADVKKIPVD